MAVQRASAGSAKDVFLPARVQVAEVITSRYADAVATTEIKESQWYVPVIERPLQWDDRVDGVDVIRTTGGEVVKLSSSGMQSVPKPGWALMLTGGDAEHGYSWTLYGIPPQQ